MDGRCPPINFQASLLAAVHWQWPGSTVQALPNHCDNPISARDGRIREKFGDEASGKTATRHLRRRARSLGMPGQVGPKVPTGSSTETG
jgi:hypothetical protein